MNKQEFETILNHALEYIVSNVEQKYGVRLSRTFAIIFSGLGYISETLDLQTALSQIYLGPNDFYPIIDIGVKDATSSTTTIVMRVSGYNSVNQFYKTWNQPDGNGPFKEILFPDFHLT
jgi:hypothetical protein